MRAPPVHKDLVLIGGGHSHVAVLRSFGMRPIPGVRLTLVTRTIETPYSGMLPGLIAGYYSHDEAHIDLAPLSRFAGARLLRAAAIAIDAERRLIELEGRPPLEYDVCSLNCGSTPTLPDSIEPSDCLTPVKPIDAFLAAWEATVEHAATLNRPIRIAIVGGGAGGVELALAAAARLRREGHDAALELLTASDRILPTHNGGARRRLHAALSRRGIAVHDGDAVVNVRGGRLETRSGRCDDFDRVFWVTHASAPGWISRSGLETDEAGFLAVDPRLQSLSHDGVFGAGDVASIRGFPRPKSGVFAVRAGKPLTANLRDAIRGRAPRRNFLPQREFLSLIGTGDGSAIASRGPFAAGGPSLWRLKEWIDRRFMRRYQQLPAMSDDEPRLTVPTDIADEQSELGDPMRCGGCGAKVGADVLAAALEGLPVGTGAAAGTRHDVEIGLGAPDDAALLAAPRDGLIAVSVDGFRTMIDDAWLFGRITATHCLNDLHAMGATPQAALAFAALPVWPQRKLVGELRLMLQGAIATLADDGAELVGGHTSESAETSLGFSVTGLVTRDRVLSKRGLNAGHRLILTKALGTGAILAAHMRARARGRWLEAAIASMCQSNAQAASVFLAFGATACTDVSGFGFLGHLSEMVAAGQTIELDIDAVPALDGAMECIERGLLSTMHPKNARLPAGVRCDESLRRDRHYPLLLDPQTAGGLLAAVPAELAVACLAALESAGYGASAIVGRVVAGGDGVTIRPATGQRS